MNFTIIFFIYCLNYYILFLLVVFEFIVLKIGRAEMKMKNSNQNISKENKIKFNKIINWLTDKFIKRDSNVPQEGNYHMQIYSILLK
jgi:hypothetical protein